MDKDAKAQEILTVKEFASGHVDIETLKSIGASNFRCYDFSNLETSTPKSAPLTIRLAEGQDKEKFIAAVIANAMRNPVPTHDFKSNIHPDKLWIKNNRPQLSKALFSNCLYFELLNSGQVTKRMYQQLLDGIGKDNSCIIVGTSSPPGLGALIVPAPLLDVETMFRFVGLDPSSNKSLPSLNTEIALCNRLSALGCTITGLDSEKIYILPPSPRTQSQESKILETLMQLSEELEAVKSDFIELDFKLWPKNQYIMGVKRNIN